MARRKKKKSKLWKSIKKVNYTRVSDGKVIQMDSSWEAKCAERLDELGVRWERTEDIKLKYIDKRAQTRNYIPDFYLPDYDIYLEVKGYWTTPARWKMRSVMDRNPGKIRLLESLEDISALQLPITPTTGSVQL
jgi:predicted nuclease of restriction endonuclease-like RecB superfamily